MFNYRKILRCGRVLVSAGISLCCSGCTNNPLSGVATINDFLATLHKRGAPYSNRIPASRTGGEAPGSSAAPSGLKGPFNRPDQWAGQICEAIAIMLR